MRNGSRLHRIWLGSQCAGLSIEVTFFHPNNNDESKREVYLELPRKLWRPYCWVVGHHRGAKRNAADAVTGYLASCRKHQDPVPAPGSGGPVSGKFLVRLPKSMHAHLIERARTEGVSMNLMVTSLVAEGLGRRGAVRRQRPARRSRSTLLA